VHPEQLAAGAPRWRVDFGDHQEYYGFAQVGAHVGLVEWNSYEIDDATFQRLVDLAATRLTELD